MPSGIRAWDFCIVNGKVYISGGHILLEYTPETDTWVKLQTPTKYHGVISLNGKLTLVGGTKTNNLEPLHVIRVWDSDSKQWTEPYP